MNSHLGLFWTLWIMGTLVMLFGLSFSLVPDASLMILGGIFSGTFVMLVPCLLLGRRALKSFTSGSVNRRSRSMLQLALGMTTILACAQSLYCLWVIIAVVTSGVFGQD
jgi:hypothetical protein